MRKEALVIVFVLIQHPNILPLLLLLLRRMCVLDVTICLRIIVCFYNVVTMTRARCVCVLTST